MEIVVYQGLAVTEIDIWDQWNILHCGKHRFDIIDAAINFQTKKCKSKQQN